MHDICLNIHYSAPKDIWEKISAVYKSMPYWDSDEKSLPHWCGEGINLTASSEPGGIQISGTMPENIWAEWYKTLKEKLTNALGYEIGEPEYGYRFKFWQPFVKKYSDIKSIDRNKIIFNDYSTFFLSDFEEYERNISAKPPYFAFKSEFIQLFIYFDGNISKKKNVRNLNDFLARLGEIGINTLDL
ncbi:MAG: hypothetical protein IJ666_07180 [Ruminococcus sp.]|nr:hypothetical protein [Ruminococcus sp.]